MSGRLAVQVMSTTIPSDNLHDLRELFLNWQPFFRLLIANLPPGVQLALLAGAVVVGAHPRSRRALSTFASKREAKLRDPAHVVLCILQALMEQLGTAEQQVWLKQEILERYIPRAAKKPLRSVARSVCLGAGHALTVDELTRGVFRAGYESSSAQFKYYLLRVLSQSEDFVCTPEGRWTVRLGEEIVAAY
jgi:hypothetical protein